MPIPQSCFKDNRDSFTVFFKQWEFYEISCVVSLKPIVHINGGKRRVRPEKKCFDHFLSISKSVAGVTIVSCVVSYNLEIRKFPVFSTLFV